MTAYAATKGGMPVVSRMILQDVIVHGLFP